MERGHCRGAASTGMCLGVVPGPPAWGADRYADLSRHSGRSSTPRSSKHARGFWYSVSGTPTASNGRGKDGVDAGNADSGGLLDLGPAQAWPAGPVSLSPSSVPGIKRCWNTQPAKAQNHPPRPPCAVIPKPPVEEREEEAPPQHRRLRWLGEGFPPPKVAPSPDSHCDSPAWCWAPRLTSSPPLLRPGQGRAGMVQPRVGSGTRCQGDSWAPGADLACKTSPCPPDPRAFPGAPASTQHPELVTDTALFPWRSQVLLPKDGPLRQGLPVRILQQQDNPTGWPVRINPQFLQDVYTL